MKYQIAAVYEALGDLDNSFIWQNRAAEDGDDIHGWLLWLNHDPRCKADFKKKAWISQKNSKTNQ